MNSTNGDRSDSVNSTSTATSLDIATPPSGLFSKIRI